MEKFLIDYAMSLQHLLFYGSLLTFALIEELVPRRSIQLPYKTRWTANFGFMLINGYLLRFFMPIAEIQLAFSLQQSQTGLFNSYPFPKALALILAILLLDGMRYGYHRLLHAVPLLWRLHRVHHSDVDFDVSTSVRHHPFEAIVSNIKNLAIIWIFGVPPLALVILHIVSSFVDLFNHSNVRIPSRLEGIIRWLWVTPDMHRIHHSSSQPETDSNFGSFFSFWDRLFASYRPQPQQTPEQMMLGLDKWRRQSEQSLYKLLLNPFFKNTD